MITNATHAQSYCSSLGPIAKKRYCEKLTINGRQLPDPYEIANKNWSDETKNWPNIGFGDIYSYLIDSKGPYTKESLKAFKSLEAYNYFYNGYVRTVYLYFDNDVYIFKARVNPSQKAADHNHEAWVAIQPNGTIITAHCKCMAGRVYNYHLFTTHYHNYYFVRHYSLGEVCSHVAAVLFD